MEIIETCPKCGHDLLSFTIAVIPPIPRKQCANCGWSWEGKPEEIIRVPFGGIIEMDSNTTILEHPIQPSNAFFDNSPCKYCNNNPVNGGSGICHCILGQYPLCW